MINHVFTLATTLSPLEEDGIFTRAISDGFEITATSGCPRALSDSIQAINTIIDTKCLLALKPTLTALVQRSEEAGNSIKFEITHYNF